MNLTLSYSTIERETSDLQYDLENAVCVATSNQKSPN